VSSKSIGMAVSAFALLSTALHAQPVDVPAPAAQSSNSKLDVPIEEIASSANGCAILDKDFPQLRGHPMYGFFKSMSLNQIAAMSHGRITAEMLARARSDLSEVPIKTEAQGAQPADLEDPAPPGDQISSGNSSPK
jgi:hypothetical protein